MSDKTKIEWTDATWNPVTGCDKVSPGCDHCYAETIAHRFAGTPAYPDGFKVTLRPERLDQPLRWTRPRRVFVNSMSDLFHADVPDTYILSVFSVMQRAPQHTFQVLTKRPGRMKSLVGWIGRKFADEGLTWPLPNVWLGVSAEDQKWANVRIPVLLDTPAAVRFVSAEPLLGPIDFFASSLIDRDSGLDWVIVGGESGHGARPMHPGWVRSIRDQLHPTGISFHFKQWGEWEPTNNGSKHAVSPGCDRAGLGHHPDPTHTGRRPAAGTPTATASWSRRASGPLAVSSTVVRGTSSRMWPDDRPSSP